MPRGKRATNSSEPLPPKRGRKRKQPTSAATGLPDELGTQSVQEQPPRGRRRRMATAEAIGQQPASATATPESVPEATPSESAVLPDLPSEDVPPSAADAGTQDPALAAAEAELVQRYSNRQIKTGSLRPAGAVPGFGHKRTVIINCLDCGRDRVVATSDLFHVGKCGTCTKAAKKASRQSKK
jgi:hypothetical protein